MGPDLDMVVFDAIRNLDIKPTLVVEGGAHGADRHARQAARLMGIPVNRICFHPDDLRAYMVSTKKDGVQVTLP